MATIKLGGREFQIVSSSTIEWDVTLLNLLSGCGLADVTMYQGETPEGLAQRVFKTLMSSGAVFEILGCVLFPIDRDRLDWVPADMRETASFLRRLSQPEDKATIKSQIYSLVAGFFAQGLLSIRTSSISLKELNGDSETSSGPESKTPPASTTSASENGG